MYVDRPPEKVRRVDRHGFQVFFKVTAAHGTRKNVRQGLEKLDVRLSFFGVEIVRGAQSCHVYDRPKIWSKDRRTNLHPLVLSAIFSFKVTTRLITNAVVVSEYAVLRWRVPPGVCRIGTEFAKAVRPERRPTHARHDRERVARSPGP